MRDLKEFVSTSSFAKDGHEPLYFNPLIHPILYILGFIESITLSTHMEEHCGGYNVSVEIFQYPTSLEWEPLKCKTKAWKYFKPGDTLIFDTFTIWKHFRLFI